MLRNLNSIKIKTPAKMQNFCSKHSAAAALKKIREKLESGPNFQDFVQNPNHNRDELAKEFEGRLKKEKGEKERLRLPPWLKTQIPIGKHACTLQRN
jgi:lipoic acid synthetase